MWVFPFAVSVLRLSGLSSSQPLASETISLPFTTIDPHAHTRTSTRRYKRAQRFRGATVKCWLNCGLSTPFFPASHRRGAQGNLCDAFNRGRIGVEIRETRGSGEKKPRGEIFLRGWLTGDKENGEPLWLRLSPARTWRKAFWGTGLLLLGQPKIFYHHYFLEGNHACPEGSCCATKHIFGSNYSEIRGTKWVPFSGVQCCVGALCCAACLLCLMLHAENNYLVVRKPPNLPYFITRLVMHLGYNGLIIYSSGFDKLYVRGPRKSLQVNYPATLSNTWFVL